jgi:hypothetical protein
MKLILQNRMTSDVQATSGSELTESRGIAFPSPSEAQPSSAENDNSADDIDDSTMELDDSTSDEISSESNFIDAAARITLVDIRSHSGPKD